MKIDKWKAASYDGEHVNYNLSLRSLLSEAQSAYLAVISQEASIEHKQIKFMVRIWSADWWSTAGGRQ